jgi:chondroitin synthase
MTTIANSVSTKSVYGESTPVSIVIPHYRRRKTLLHTLATLNNLNHNLSVLECIIVDDGSPPSEQPCLTHFESKIDIKVIYLEDQGYQVSRARNIGIQNAKHDIIIILDCDLGVEPSFVESHLLHLNRSESTISVGLRDSYSKISEKNSDPNSLNIEALKDSSNFIRTDWRITHIDYKNKNEHNYWKLCSGGNIAFHKSLFANVGQFNEDFVFWGGEDTEWAYRAYKKGVYFEIHSEVKSFHFECFDDEFQIDRYKDISLKNNILQQLVPSLEDYKFTKGTVPFVSIFVTHYNKLEYLKECLDSIHIATSFRYEVVLVDDFSENVTDEMLQEVIPETIKPYVTLVRNEQNEGVEKTFKRAIKVCKGEFIAQLDADDYLLPNAVDTLINELNLHSADIAYGKHKILKDSILSDGWVCKDATREMRTLHGMYYHPLRVFRARAIHRVGGMRILGLEGAIDFSLYSQMELLCKAIFCDVYTYVYRQVENSITNTKFAAQVEGVRKVIEDNANRISSTKDYEIIQVEERLYNVKFKEHDLINYPK